MESKLLVGGKNIVDHTNEQQKMLELKRQEIAEQVYLTEVDHYHDVIIVSQPQGWAFLAGSCSWLPEIAVNNCDFDIDYNYRDYHFGNNRAARVIPPYYTEGHN